MAKRTAAGFPAPSPLDPRQIMRFPRVRCAEDADPNALIVTLFRCEAGIVRGWYLGPMSTLNEGGRIPYAPASLRLLAIVAIVHARRIARRSNLPIWIVDPTTLWEDMLRGR